MTTAVFVTSITKRDTKVIVEASNGDPETGPFVRFELPASHHRNCFVGKRYEVTVDSPNEES